MGGFFECKVISSCRWQTPSVCCAAAVCLSCSAIERHLGLSVGSMDWGSELYQGRRDGEGVWALLGEGEGKEEEGCDTVMGWGDGMGDGGGIAV